MTEPLNGHAGRQHALDAARGILMMLGLFLHSASVYSVGASWLVSDPQRWAGFDFLAGAIHVFRMPAFFWLSGYLAAMTYTKVGAMTLLKRRVRRVLVPFVSCWLSLNLLQEYLLAAPRGASLADVLADGIGMYHLWFLLDLLIYVTVAAAVLPWLAPRLARMADWTWPHWSLLLPVLGCAALLFNVAARATGLAYASPFGLTDLFRLTTYGPYFLGGVVMYLLPALQRVLFRVPGPLLLLFVPLATMLKSWQPGHGALIGELASLGITVLTWGCVGALLGLLTRVFASDSVMTRMSNEVSYTVYLFHHLTVVWLGQMMVGQPWGVVPKYLMLVGLTLAITLAIHVLLIRRVTLLSQLFNGRRPTVMKLGFVSWLKASAHTEQTRLPTR